MKEQSAEVLGREQIDRVESLLGALDMDDPPHLLDVLDALASNGFVLMTLAEESDINPAGHAYQRLLGRQNGTS